jgi:DNA polymerase-1
MSTKTLLLIDTYALAHRAFHAFPTELKTKRGEQTNAIYGFSSMLLQVLKLFQPDFIVCALDSKGPTIRHQQYALYKANRPKMDEGLAEQIGKIKKLIDTFNIPAIEKQGYEADDIIGSIVKSPKYADHCYR